MVRNTAGGTPAHLRGRGEDAEVEHGQSGREEERQQAEAERFALACGRLRGVQEEETVPPPYRAYFRQGAAFLLLLAEEYRCRKEGRWSALSLPELEAANRALYADILTPHYPASYANPVFAVKCFGTDMGRLLCALQAELRSAIPAACEGRLFFLIIRMEVFLETYSAFVCAAQEGGAVPKPEEVRQILYWYVSDYLEAESRERRACQLDPARDFALRIVRESDLADPCYLYAYGEYVTESSRRTAAHLAALPEETIRRMADAYTEGYRLGFAATGKDLTTRRVVELRYPIGFERMIRRALDNFAGMSLQATACRACASLLGSRSLQRAGYGAASPNRQYDYDHREDEALVLDRPLLRRKTEALTASWEACRALAGVQGGPAVVETFGEAPFAPAAIREACAYSGAQRKLAAAYTARAQQTAGRYVDPAARSYTIIAFPSPEIGARYGEILEEVIRINTVENERIRRIQQTLIDALDQGVCVRVRGRNGNRTDLCVALRPLDDPARETLFENCVADVNIPAGEVFTSPQLAGTDGVLHVKRAFLDGLEYRDLELTFRDGMTEAYRCGNFPDPEQGRRYIRDNLLFHYERLPMGEFAIGTNTAAYRMARRYDLFSCLPILIAEKMGPHFAVGDTCYSREEENDQYNPDGKKLVAKDNSISALRHTQPEQAYFGCHTDIPLPYDELGEVTVTRRDGSRQELLRDGRFVLPGCGELNRPLDEPG